MRMGVGPGTRAKRTLGPQVFVSPAPPCPPRTCFQEVPFFDGPATFFTIFFTFGFWLALNNLLCFRAGKDVKCLADTMELFCAEMDAL